MYVHERMWNLQVLEKVLLSAKIFCETVEPYLKRIIFDVVKKNYQVLKNDRLTIVWN